MHRFPGGTLAAALAPLALAAWLSGCSLDYGAALSESLAADVPDMVIYDFAHTVVENGFPLFRLNAEKAELFTSLNKTRLSAVSFSQYASDGSGRLVTEGRADTAVFWTKTESADLYGAVSFRSEEEGLRVESGNIKWDGEARTLTSGNDTVTTLIDDDGSRLAGSGFSADGARRSFSFAQRVDGTIASPAGNESAADGGTE